MVVRDEPGRCRSLRRGGEGGQSTVELALVLPVVLLLAVVVVQVGLVVRDQIRVTHAAREGARAAAVDPDPDAAARAVERSGVLAPGRLEVRATGRGDPGSAVTVTVRYESPTDLPLVGALVPDVGLEAEATMRVER